MSMRSAGLSRAGVVWSNEIGSADSLLSHGKERTQQRFSGIAGIGFGQTFQERQHVTVAFQRGAEIALRDLHVADLPE